MPKWGSTYIYNINILILQYIMTILNIKKKIEWFTCLTILRDWTIHHSMPLV